MTDLRIGVLGAARIAPTALIKPAREIHGVTVTAVAARDRERAAVFAARHQIPRVLPDYAAIVDDPDIDAVYIPLPNGLHAHWIREAIAAGKHVLCEKPFTSNAAQAQEIADLHRASAVTVMEAFHYRYHPLAARIRDIVRHALGDLQRVETAMCIPLPRFGDIRYQYDLAGGALMDAGCYAVHAARLIGNSGAPRPVASTGEHGPLGGTGEPTINGARAKTLRRDRRIDRAMTIDLAYPDGATGRVRASMWSSSLLNVSIKITGSLGSMRVFNFAAPQYFHRFVVRANMQTTGGPGNGGSASGGRETGGRETGGQAAGGQAAGGQAAGGQAAGGRRRFEKVAGETSYTHQLRAFLAATRGEPTNLTPPEDSVRTMRLIDAAYKAAGLPLRP